MFCSKFCTIGYIATIRNLQCTSFTEVITV